jgi:hypothetical protein
MKKISVSIFIFSMLLACKPSQEPTPAAPVAEEVPAATETVSNEVIEFAPESFMNSIKARANGVEATMYSTGASFSMDKQENVFAFSSQIAFQAPKALSKNHIGHIMFLENGNKILFSNVYTNGTDVYIQINDEETGKVYYNILLDKVKDLFVNVQVQAK